MVELSKLTPMMIQQLYNNLTNEGKLASENIQKVHTLINDALKKAAAWKMIAENPASRVERPKATKSEIQVWDKHEAKHFLQVAMESRYYIAFLLALTTGMRQGEILGVRWKDIDLDNGILYVIQTLDHSGKHLTASTKTKAGKRNISLPDETIFALKKHMRLVAADKRAADRLYKDHDLVVCTSIGTPTSPRNLCRSFYNLIKKAKIKRIRFHDMRHTHATLLLLQDVHPKIVSERLGHANVRITLDTYSHLLPSMQKDTAKNFGRFLFGGDDQVQPNLNDSSTAWDDDNDTGMDDHVAVNWD
jgi:integrase